MSALLKTQDSNTTFKKISFSLLLMLFCLFITCSSSEMKKSKKSLSKKMKKVKTTIKNKENEPNIQQSPSFLETAAEEKLSTKSKLSQGNETVLQPNTTVLEPVESDTTSSPATNPLTLNNPVYQQPPQAVNPTNSGDPYEIANTKTSCTQMNCFYPNVCISNFVCKCGNENANYFKDSISSENPPYYCAYGRKKQLVAFLLEFFLPSFGHLYAGQYAIGVLKLLLPCVFVVLLYVIQNTLVKGIAGAGLCGMSIWWLVDIILYGLNKYSDQNGVRLASW